MGKLEELVMVFLLFVGLPYLCARLAIKKNRNVPAAVILGLLFNIWALLGYLLVWTKKD